VLGGEMRVMTIMFCDIRGFTTLTEGMGAHTLTHFMNSFLSPMTELITERKGTIDRYIGRLHHGLLERAARRSRARPARGARRPGDAPGTRRVEPAMGRRGGSEGPQRGGGSRRYRHQHRGMRCRQFRLVDAFPLFAARRPGKHRLAARKRWQALWDRSRHRRRYGPGPGADRDRPLTVKGKSRSGRVFTLLLPPECEVAAEFAEPHGAFLAAYRRQDWSAAQRLLDEHPLAGMSHLAPVYSLDRQRIGHYRSPPPAADWDGVFATEDK
jgi:adenylate cyclase